ncbi:MAG: hypothetical protein LR011_08690 [Verrucomicrobia bacterium]|nr:hypothetical protein [Verrucomicrobiota bacterium]
MKWVLLTLILSTLLGVSLSYLGKMNRIRIGFPPRDIQKAEESGVAENREMPEKQELPRLPHQVLIQPSPAERSMTLFHGSDGSGADGEWAKAGFDICRIHVSREDVRMSELEPLIEPGWCVTNQGMVMNIICQADCQVGQFESLLRHLGMQESFVFGGVITGYVPFQLIPTLVKREEIAFMCPAGHP